MGQAKKAQMEHEEKVQQAISLLIDFGAIEECEEHEGTYIDSQEYFDFDELTTLILENNPDSLELFESKSEMTECIGEAMSFAGDECYSCEKFRNS